VFGVFVRARIARTTERVSVSSNGVQAERWSLYPALSATGRFVVFTSVHLGRAYLGARRPGHRV
jgi:hypothetical protein